LVRHSVALGPGANLPGFRDAVRLLIARDIAPRDVTWSCTDRPSLFGEALSGDAQPLMLPRSAADLIDSVICHRDPERYALLYTLIWRLRHGERTLLEIASDPVTHRLENMRKSVRRDIHKMHAFLRFRRAPAPEEHFVAWFEPEHHILAAVAPFFIERFRGMRWSIITPMGSLHWDREQLVCGSPGRRSDAPLDDAFEAGWRGYYESVFNPARANPEAMRLHMPKKYWRNMPETEAIPDLLRSAAARVDTMLRDGNTS
jgi:probable DNA metabolism protein